MIIHHMRDGTIRESIDGMVIPASFENVYKLVQVSKKENKNGDSDTSRDFRKEQVLDR